MLRILIVFILVLSFSGCMNSWDKHSTTYKIDGVVVEVPVEIDGEPVPPDPGEDGTETLLGIDSNDNGVRDDVERYIAARFYNYEHANKERAIAMQYARAMQKILEHGPKMAMITEKKMRKASECKWAYYHKYHDYDYRSTHKMFDSYFKDIVFNTKDRLETYFDYNEALSGHAFSYRIVSRISECEVDITKIEN